MACFALAACADPAPAAANAAAQTPRSADPRHEIDWINWLRCDDWRLRNRAASKLYERIRSAKAAPFGAEDIARLVEFIDDEPLVGERLEPGLAEWFDRHAGEPWERIREASLEELLGSTWVVTTRPSPLRLVLGPEDLIVPWPAADLATWLLRSLPTAAIATLRQRHDQEDVLAPLLRLREHENDAAALLERFAADPAPVMRALWALSGAYYPAFCDLALPEEPRFDTARFERLQLYDLDTLLPVHVQRDAVRLIFAKDEPRSREAACRLLDGPLRERSDAVLAEAFAVAGRDPRSQCKLAALACCFAPIPAPFVPRLVSCLRGDDGVARDPTREWALLALSESDLRSMERPTRELVAANAMAAFAAAPPEIGRLALTVVGMCGIPVDPAQARELRWALQGSDSRSFASHVVGILHLSPRSRLDVDAARSLALWPSPTALSLLATSDDGADEAWLHANLDRLFTGATSDREPRILARELGQRRRCLLEAWLAEPESGRAAQWIALEGLSACGALSDADLAQRSDDPHAIDLLIGRGAAPETVLDAMRRHGEIREEWIGYLRPLRLPIDHLVDLCESEFRRGLRLEILADRDPMEIRRVLLRFFQEDPQPYRTRLLTALCELDLDVPFDPTVERALLQSWGTRSAPVVPAAMADAWRLPEAVVDAVLARFADCDESEWDPAARDLVLRHRGCIIRR